jgi:cytochrome c-type biogenesis protein CcmH
MFSFWLIAALLLLLPLFVIMISLLRTHKNNNIDLERGEDIYKQRLLEIESDIANGLLSDTDAENVKKEIQLAILNHDKNSQEQLLTSPSGTAIKSPTITAILLLILVPVFVIGLYQHLGQPDTIMQESVLSEFHNAEGKEEKLASIEKMISQLEKRLINEPDNIDGWIMLTNSYASLERYPGALRAVDNLYRLNGDDPTVLLRYADILSMVNGGVFTGKPTDLINQALQLEPENPNGLWLAGLAANERGEINNAINYWQRLVPKLEQGSEPQQQIKQYIQLARQHLDNTENGMAGDKPIQDDKSPAKANAIQLNVSLSAELINEANDNDIVFIYAKAIGGPPIPLAVLRKKVSDLPLQATLDDSMAMMASNKLSDHEQVQLIARISKSGNVKPESGDLIGTLNAVQTDLNEPINLIISNKVQ